MLLTDLPESVRYKDTRSSFVLNFCRNLYTRRKSEVEKSFNGISGQGIAAIFRVVGPPQ
jgi:hypothetical protein